MQALFGRRAVATETCAQLRVQLAERSDTLERERAAAAARLAALQLVQERQRTDLVMTKALVTEITAKLKETTTRVTKEQERTRRAEWRITGLNTPRRVGPRSRKGQGRGAGAPGAGAGGGGAARRPARRHAAHRPVVRARGRRGAQGERRGRRRVRVECQWHARVSCAQRGARLSLPGRGRHALARGARGQAHRRRRHGRRRCARLRALVADVPCRRQPGSACAVARPAARAGRGPLLPARVGEGAGAAWPPRGTGEERGTRGDRASGGGQVGRGPHGAYPHAAHHQRHPARLHAWRQRGTRHLLRDAGGRSW